MTAFEQHLTLWDRATGDVKITYHYLAFQAVSRTFEWRGPALCTVSYPFFDYNAPDVEIEVGAEFDVGPYHLRILDYDDISEQALCRRERAFPGTLRPWTYGIRKRTMCLYRRLIIAACALGLGQATIIGDREVWYPSWRNLQWAWVEMRQSKNRNPMQET